MLHHKIPFLRIIIPLCAGIISAYFFRAGQNVIIPFALLTAGVLISSARKNRKPTDYLFSCLFACSLFTAGMLLYYIEKRSISELPAHEAVYTVAINDFPEEKAKSYKAVAELISVRNGSENTELTGSLLLYFEKDESLTEWQPGDIIAISCVPSQISNRGNPSEFDYRFYMENKGVRYTSYVRKEKIISHTSPERRNLRSAALIIRNKIIDIYSESGIAASRIGLVAAMTLGDKTMLEPGQKESFMKAGVMHIMAVSGLHAVILSMFVFNILFFLRGRLNILRILTALFILWAFAFVTGLTPSVLRATLMFTFLQAGNLLKRRSDPVNSVLASAFVLILIRPSVIFDSGFLLSYSAVIFIIIFYRDLYLKLQLNNILADKVWQSIAVTFTAQAGTLPFTIMFFNMFSVYFLLTNLIIVPLSSLLIIIGCLIPLFYKIKFLAMLCAYAADKLAAITILLTEHAAALPGALMENIGLSLPEALISGIIISLLFARFVNGKKISTSAILLFILIFSIFRTAERIQLRQSSELIVYNTPGLVSVGIRTGSIMNFYSFSDTIPETVRHHANSAGLHFNRFVMSSVPVLIRSDNYCILLNNRIDESIISEFAPDAVILTGRKPETESKIITTRHGTTFIISPEASSAYISKGLKEVQKQSNLHYVGISGAYTSDL